MWCSSASFSFCTRWNAFEKEKTYNIYEEKINNKPTPVYYFEKGDTIEVFTPNHEKETFVVERLLDDDKNEIDVARHPDNIYYVELKSKIKIPEYSMLRIVKRNK